jgi:hypothetical protein
MSVLLANKQPCGSVAVSPMQPGAMVLLADALQQVLQHARRANTDLALRRRLAAQQAGDRVQEERCIPDPPLLRQESEASHAYLSVLMHVASSSRMPGWRGAEQARQAMKVSTAVRCCCSCTAHGCRRGMSFGVECRPNQCSSACLVVLLRAASWMYTASMAAGWADLRLHRYGYVGNAAECADAARVFVL